MCSIWQWLNDCYQEKNRRLIEFVLLFSFDYTILVFFFDKRAWKVTRSQYDNIRPFIACLFEIIVSYIVFQLNNELTW